MRFTGDMPSVATGALVANAKLLCIGISGDGDTANIGMGQFKHICRRNVPIVYVVENNGCYGLTKGQFSATADLNQHLRRPTGEANDVAPFDLCTEAIVGGATFVARSFAGDKKQMVPLLKAALKHKGTSVLDIISPCVTFNDFDGSTKSWDWAKEHEEPLHDVSFVPRLPEIEVEQKAGETTRVQLHDGSWITLEGPQPPGARRHQQGVGVQAPGGEHAKERVPHGVDLRRRQAARFLDEPDNGRHAAGALAAMKTSGRRKRCSRRSWRRFDRPAAVSTKSEISNPKSARRMFVDKRRADRARLADVPDVRGSGSVHRRDGGGQESGPPLPGTKPLTMTGDLASEMVAGADRFLLKQIEESAGKREKYWKRDFSSAEAYQASVEPNRKRLAHILGVRDARVPSVVRKVDTRHGGRRTAGFVPEARCKLSNRFGELDGVWRCDRRRARTGSEDRIACRGHRPARRHRDSRTRTSRPSSLPVWPTVFRPNRRWRAGWPRTGIA